MFLTSITVDELHNNFESIGLKKEINTKNEVLIKINLARVYQKNHPRTDMILLKTLINYIYQNGGKCAIAEDSDGFLRDNLINSGLEDIMNSYNIRVIDIDCEDCDEVISYDEHHYIPKCFRDYPVRIALPATSKRVNMYYSNNIKLFVGAVSRKMYQLDGTALEKHAPRPKLHQNLDLSISNLFLAIKEYSPFQFYMNGGLSFNENIGEFNITETYVGNDALELDCHLFQRFFSDCEYPDYINILKYRLANK